ncbi:MAG TPA: isoaspartyl peptidase/L-asparaginase [Acidobacteriota bacterium]|nr:isoaspartyl peptidase/L-asparaginase [Acidobacteriota bacterium]
MRKRILFAALSVLLLAAGCGGAPPVQAEKEGQPLDYAIAIHGGAGVIPRDIDPEIRQGYEDSLKQALELGRSMLEEGRASLDVVETVIRTLEDDPRFNAGKGAVYTWEGRHELDASIMDGRDLSCGAVTGVKTVRHPITLARKVMEETRHVFLSHDGAETFARQMDLERVENSFFDTERRRKQWQEMRDRAEQEMGTVGVAVLDKNGDLAAGTSTGGMTGKRWGRIGDSPVVGAGTYADNRSVAVSCTGTGEEFIRNVIAYQVSALMTFKGLSLQEAAEEVIHKTLKKGDGGLIAVSHRGEIAMVFNSDGMFRGAADSSGRFEVAIWD